jgi:argininosuccinate lyase
MTLWGGRFAQKLDPNAWDLNASIAVDQRLALQDVQGSLAWASALHQAQILSADEYAQISAGLQSIQQEFTTPR